MRDPASLNKPSTHDIGAANMIGLIPGTEVHWGLVFGIIAAVLAYILVYRTVFGFAARIAGGNMRAAKVVGLRGRQAGAGDVLPRRRRARGWPA